MSDKMQPIEFRNLLNWIIKEYVNQKTIFGIPSSKFFCKKDKGSIEIFNDKMDLPIGPAAGPHTQMAQNILASYLTGGRFFELKTVQKLDKIKIDKPCIDVEDEGYNVEWSEELTLEQSYSEYLKAWFLLQFVNSLFSFSNNSNKGFIFNMSVGYDLEGIRTPGMDLFIEKLKDASITKEFNDYKKTLNEFIKSENTIGILKKIFLDENTFLLVLKRLHNLVNNISPFISNSVTLSTMHGCPANEIESIAKYLVHEKKLHPYIKLNPTLLGYDYVKDSLSKLGYSYIELDKLSFTNDLRFEDAISMIKRLKDFSMKHQRVFGIKLSNTLGVKNKKGILPGGQMYMSGRSLFPLTINLAYKIAKELNGEINISYSGGANIQNIIQILNTGIYPVTMATELLKPGGYLRLSQISNTLETENFNFNTSFPKINLNQLKELAYNSLNNPEYKKEKRDVGSLKINKRLKKFDCYISPCMEVCPVHQDVAEYINLVEEKNYEEAFQVIISKNPLPNITGYICDHQCMDKCTRWDYESPVLIRELKKEAAEKGIEHYFAKNKKDFAVKYIGIKTDIIGAGPAGLSAAYFLGGSGFDVTIFERTDKAGGTVQHIIPGFRLPQSAIEKDIELIKKFGAHIVYGCDSNFSISKLQKQGYKYIFIGIGAPKSNRLNFSSNDNTYDAVEFLKLFNQKKNIKLGKSVAVIGGGNSAMDAARASIRSNGVQKVYIIYRRTKEFMPADKEEFDASIKEGVIFKELLMPVSYSNKKLKCQKMQLGEYDKDGRRKVHPVKNKFEEFEIDSIISAIGEHVDYDILKENKLVGKDENRLVFNHETNETKISNVYIGGDALRGPSTVVESIADGKKAAESILSKEGIKLNNIELSSLTPVNEEHISKIENKRGNIIAGNILDLNVEASRCLECNLLCNKCVEVCPNRANVAIKTNSHKNELKDYYQILHLDALCNECGNCETFCPYSDAPYKIKTTLFNKEEDFNESKNDGFYFIDSDDSLYNFKIRYNSQNGIVSLNKKGNVVASSIKDDLKDFNIFINFINNIFMNYNYLLNVNL